MATRPEVEQFVRDLELYAKHRLSFPAEIAQFISLIHAKNSEVFEDAIFHAKFAVKSQEIMKRIGPDGEGYDKLSAEFRASVEKTSTLLKTLVKESPDELKLHMVKTFFEMNPEAFQHFMGLLVDLSWIKNWQVDGRPLPYQH